MTANANVHFGVTLPQIKRPWVAAAGAARAFESMGFDSVWVCDHLYGPQSPQLPILEAWSMIAAVAAITERVELGTLVTPAGMRNPAQLGKTIASVDNIAGGRVIAGLGGGWMPREFTDFGMPFHGTGQRLKQLAETVELFKRMWGDEDEVSYDGDYVQASGVVCQPKPPRKVPILIGGAGEQVTMKIAAREADIWNNLAGQQAVLDRKIDVLRRHCARDRPGSQRHRRQPAVPGHDCAGRRAGRSDGRSGSAHLWRPHGRSQRTASHHRHSRALRRTDPQAH